MSQYIYTPVIKTRDAELKAFANLKQNIKNSILPIFELTKSRKTKNIPDGDIHKRMVEIKKIAGENPFILDLSTNEKYLNPQIETLLSPNNGFYEWVYFINSYSHLNIIPMIHIYDDEDFSDIEAFVSSPHLRGRDFAVRLPYDEQNINEFIDPIIRNLENSNLYVIIDVGQISSNLNEIETSIKERIIEIKSCRYNKIKIIVTATSFPKLVGPYGENNGEFPISEEILYQKLKKEFDIIYGDYGSINIEQVEIKGGTFIPRIDISLSDKFFYERYRRHEGSYARCAKNIVKNIKYIPIQSWADEEIILASVDAPSGISPSFWIAVRMNYFMTKRVMMRRSDEL